MYAQSTENAKGINVNPHLYDLPVLPARNVVMQQVKPLPSCRNRLLGQIRRQLQRPLVRPTQPPNRRRPIALRNHLLVRQRQVRKRRPERPDRVEVALQAEPLIVEPIHRNVGRNAQAVRVQAARVQRGLRRFRQRLVRRRAVHAQPRRQRRGVVVHFQVGKILGWLRGQEAQLAVDAGVVGPEELLHHQPAVPARDGHQVVRDGAHGRRDELALGADQRAVVGAARSGERNRPVAFAEEDFVVVVVRRGVRVGGEGEAHVGEVLGEVHGHAEGVVDRAVGVVVEVRQVAGDEGVV